MTTTVFSQLATELKRQRQKKKISRQKLANILHIPTETLIQIENPATSSIPDSYLIGLYRRYGRAVEFDKQQLADLLAAAEVKTKMPQKRTDRRYKGDTLFIFSTIQRATATIIVAVVALYAVWQFGQLYSSPLLEIDSLPERGLVSSESKLTVSGRSDVDAAVYVNGDPLTVDADGIFSFDLYLQEGFNGIEFTAINNFSRTTTVYRTVFFDLNENPANTIDEQG